MACVNACQIQHVMLVLIPEHASQISGNEKQEGIILQTDANKVLLNVKVVATSLEGCSLLNNAGLLSDVRPAFLIH